MAALQENWATWMTGRANHPFNFTLAAHPANEGNPDRIHGALPDAEFRQFLLGYHVMTGETIKTPLNVLNMAEDALDRLFKSAVKLGRAYKWPEGPNPRIFTDDLTKISAKAISELFKKDFGTVVDLKTLTDLHEALLMTFPQGLGKAAVMGQLAAIDLSLIHI